MVGSGVGGWLAWVGGWLWPVAAGVGGCGWRWLAWVGGRWWVWLAWAAGSMLAVGELWVAAWLWVMGVGGWLAEAGGGGRWFLRLVEAGSGGRWRLVWLNGLKLLEQSSQNLKKKVYMNFYPVLRHAVG